MVMNIFLLSWDQSVLGRLEKHGRFYGLKRKKENFIILQELPLWWWMTRGGLLLNQFLI